MKYDTFIDEIREQVQLRLYGRKVTHKRMMKYNGVYRDALLIGKTGSNISPTIYLEEYYERYQRGHTIDRIADDITALYQECEEKVKLNDDDFRDFSAFRDRVVYRILGREANEELLKRIPHIIYLDFAIVFFVLLEMDDSSHGMILLYHQHMSLWNIKVEDLYDAARMNTPRLLPPVIMNMDDVIRQSLDDTFHTRFLECSHLREDGLEGEPTQEEAMIDRIVEELELTDQNCPMYVITNQWKMYGAGVILYDQLLMKLAAKLSSDLYLIPSSVHEFIAVPEQSGMTEEQLTEMVRNVNETEVSREEILSDHVYHYRRAYQVITY